LKPTDVVADVGAGTGILSELFLQHGYAVVAIEPNGAMRAALERLIGRYPSLRVVDGAAEATTLPASSIDLVVVGQAFHWFEPDRARREFSRILRVAGRVALLWNIRDTESTGFMRGYESLLLRYAPEYECFRSGPVNPVVLSEFFGPGGYGTCTLSNDVEFDFPRLEGLVRSTSYAPHEGQPAFAPMIEALRALFDAHQADGTILMRYETRVFYGRC
jgi:SAM-dependent methyltransferase